MPTNVTELTVSGTEYTNVDGYSFIFVGDGIAFGETLAVEGGYYVSVGPYALDDLDESDGVQTERTLYRAGSTLYLAGDPDLPISLSVPDYDIDGECWQYGDRIAVSEVFGPIDEGEDDEYLVFSSTQYGDDDILVPIEAAESHLMEGRIRQLWPVWTVAHR